MKRSRVLRDLAAKARVAAETAAGGPDAPKLVGAEALTGEALSELTKQINDLSAEASRLEAEANQAEQAEAEQDRATQSAVQFARSASQVNARRTAPDPIEGAGGVIEVGADRRRQDPKLGFKHFGEAAALVMLAADPRTQRQAFADHRFELLAGPAGMNMGSGPDGGYLIPTAFAKDVWDGLNNGADSLLAMTDQYTVTGVDSIELPANAETSRANGSRYGGIAAYWINEAKTITASTIKFRKLKLEPQQLAMLIPVTDKLLKNSPIALGQLLTKAATEEINFMVSDAIMSGNGAGQPLGILNSPGRVTVAAVSAQGAGTIVAKNINAMWARVSKRAKAGGFWFINGDIIPELDALVLPTGTGSGQVVYMPPQGIADPPLGRLKGRPIIEIEQAPTLGTEGDIMFADMSYYASATRGGVDEAMSIHFYFDTAQTAFRFMFDVDGQPWLNTPITPAKGSATRSPFVTLSSTRT